LPRICACFCALQPSFDLNLGIAIPGSAFQGWFEYAPNGGNFHSADAWRWAEDEHRILDGADAGKVMAEFKKTLENWSGDIRT